MIEKRGNNMPLLKYDEQLQNEIRQVPEEYLPALLNIVHAFRESVSLKGAEESVRQGWQESLDGDIQPIEKLWDGLDA
jgi:hypothetical protein